jgi:hypothetical protein
MAEHAAHQASWGFAPVPVSKPELPRWTAPYASMIFSDESSQKKKFFVLGALYFWAEASNRKAEIDSLEKRLTDLKAQYGLCESVNGRRFQRQGDIWKATKPLSGKRLKSTECVSNAWSWTRTSIR